jgi:hypothetical protein
VDAEKKPGIRNKQEAGIQVLSQFKKIPEWCGGFGSIGKDSERGRALISRQVRTG